MRPYLPEKPKPSQNPLSWTRIRQSFTYTPATFGLAWKSAPRLFVGLGLLTLVNAFLPLLIAWLGKLIIDAVVAGDSALTLQWVAIELGVMVFQSFSQRGLSLCRQLIGGRLAIDINVRILEKALTLDLKDFENPEFYDQLVRARREASSRPLAVVSDSFMLIQHGLTLSGYLVLLMNLNVWAVIGLFLAAMPAALAEIYFSTTTFWARNRRSAELRKLNYLEYVLANDSHVKEVKLFKLGPTLLRRYQAIAESMNREDQQLSLRRSTWGYLLSLIGTLAFYLCYAWIAMAAALKKLSLGDLTFYVAAFRQGQQSFQSILGTLGGMYENNLYMSNLFAFLAIPETTATPPERVITARQEEGIRFEQVSFQYPGQTQEALSDINLFIPKGQSLALVGHNGAGKTTFIKLLTRLYRPTRGRILLDGKDLQDWAEDVLLQRMAVVFQDFNRYQMSFAENVAMGSIQHETEQSRLLRAIDHGGADGVLQGLPKGLETPLGRWFHDGVELSGGQWQKIALARAFMREEADILVLDEPTAALDAEAEFAVFNSFRALTRDRTSILISHRFPTVRMADTILVIEGGQIIEQGSHDQLIAAQGRYAKLFALQASGYV
ncbi:MAG TPA: ABC transporter ATP-binding protein [Oligoflexus sp.]|uniref:ABC transporter ATP-binding protein n=1 Tax=Oligoflexus sp. TaxID=1971216 RepID=UPI002D352E84|nr:ABC transporter ATP-binding protein [Oligoflexus sp.]HYX33115.1 ABC transporter ATP-binding protein [Oligoflexus sp.]